METEIEKLKARDTELAKKCEELGKERCEINAEIARLKKGERRFTLVRRLASNPGDRNGYLWFDSKKKLFVYSDLSADGEYGKVAVPTQTDDGVLWLTGQSWIEARSWSADGEVSIVIRFDVTAERDEKDYKIMVNYAAGMELIELCQFPLPHTHDQTPMARALGLLVNDRREMIKVRQRLPESVRAVMRALRLPMRDVEPVEELVKEPPCRCQQKSATDSCGGCMTKEN